MFSYVLFYAYQICVMNMYHFHKKIGIIILKDLAEPEESILRSVR
jgi:hypothetical protein